MAEETAEARRKRLRMRSWRRGTREMDLVLGPFAEARLDGVDLGLYDRLLAESDQDLILWVTGQAAAPPRFAGLVAEIADFAASRLKTR